MNVYTSVLAPVVCVGADPPDHLTVGHVTAIALDPKTYQGVVTLRIESGVLFPKDSSAKILTAGLLGEQYVGVEPGADEKNLAPGDTIGATQSAVVLENLIGQFLYSKAEDGKPAPAAPPKK